MQKTEDLLIRIEQPEYRLLYLPQYAGGIDWAVGIGMINDPGEVSWYRGRSVNHYEPIRYTGLSDVISQIVAEYFRDKHI